MPGRFSVALLLLGLISTSLQARETLRLPWVFSDDPGLTVDLYFEAHGPRKTAVQMNIGGRFSEFGLPNGAARAPILKIQFEFYRPENLSRRVLLREGSLDLNEVLSSYGKSFDASHFNEKSRFLYKTSLSAVLRPGEYNLQIKLVDQELSVSSDRTLFVTVPAMDHGLTGLGDLRFVTAWGERLTKKREIESVFDSNPWRQVGPGLERDLSVAFKMKGLKRWQATVKHLRSGKERWNAKGNHSDNVVAGMNTLNLNYAAMKKWKRGVYILELSAWPGPGKSGEKRSSKTFELIP